MPINQCVGHFYFGFGQRGWNPFSEAVKNWQTDGTWQCLENYYRAFQPTSLAEAYFLRNHPRWSVLNNMPPLLRFKPWRETTPLISGHSGGGNQNFGPVSAEKFCYETRRYESLLSSIQKNGYDPRRYGYIKGYYLINERGDYVFRITQGMHRAAVLDALGVDLIPVMCDPRLPAYVHIATLPYWPKVQSGECPPEVARYMFNRHFWDRGRLKKRKISET